MLQDQEQRVRTFEHWDGSTVVIVSPRRFCDASAPSVAAQAMRQNPSQDLTLATSPARTTTTTQDDRQERIIKDNPFDGFLTPTQRKEVWAKEDAKVERREEQALSERKAKGETIATSFPTLATSERARTQFADARKHARTHADLDDDAFFDIYNNSSPESDISTYLEKEVCELAADLNIPPGPVQMMASPSPVYSPAPSSPALSPRDDAFTPASPGVKRAASVDTALHAPVRPKKKVRMASVYTFARRPNLKLGSYPKARPFGGLQRTSSAPPTIEMAAAAARVAQQQQQQCEAPRPSLIVRIRNPNATPTGTPTGTPRAGNTPRSMVASPFRRPEAADESMAAALAYDRQRFNPGSTKAAVFEVLEGASTRGMHVTDIVKACESRGLRSFDTVSVPRKTVESACHTDPVFVRVAPGTFALRAFMQEPERVAQE